MKIKSIHIENFKSLVDFRLTEPNPFSVFVGANGVGKSNIFEALEFLNYLNNSFEATSVINNFGGLKSIVTKILQDDDRIRIIAKLNDTESTYTIDHSGKAFGNQTGSKGIFTENNFNKILFDEKLKPQFHERFSRIFINNSKVLKTLTTSDYKLNIDSSNLENVLKRILDNANTREEIIEWLQIFIPEFEKIEIHTSALSGKSELAVFEKTLNQPLTKNLISDGTYNILSLLTAVFQSDEPQFLCIEEPENGLHPYVIRELVKFFRQQCEEKGHYIWLNTHSQTLVDELQPHEIILVDKKDGATQIKQFSKDKNLHGLKMDFAWLSNSLGGGVPW